MKLTEFGQDGNIERMCRMGKLFDWRIFNWGKYREEDYEGSNETFATTYFFRILIGRYSTGWEFTIYDK